MITMVEILFNGYSCGFTNKMKIAKAYVKKKVYEHNEKVKNTYSAPTLGSEYSFRPWFFENAETAAEFLEGEKIIEQITSNS